MKTNHKNKALTLGHLIESVYGACGNRRAKGIIRLAMDANVIVLRERGAMAGRRTLRD